MSVQCRFQDPTSDSTSIYTSIGPTWRKGPNRATLPRVEHHWHSQEKVEKEHVLFLTSTRPFRSSQALESTPSGLHQGLPPADIEMGELLAALALIGPSGRNKNLKWLAYCTNHAKVYLDLECGRRLGLRNCCFVWLHTFVVGVRPSNCRFEISLTLHGRNLKHIFRVIAEV